MSYVIYELESTLYVHLLRDRRWQVAEYKTMAAARAGWNRHNKWLAAKGKPLLDTATHGIAEKGYFTRRIEKTRKTRNMLNPDAGESDIPVNTPSYMDPGCESYHSL